MSIELTPEERAQLYRRIDCPVEWCSGRWIDHGGDGDDPSFWNHDDEVEVKLPHGAAMHRTQLGAGPVEMDAHPPRRWSIHQPAARIARGLRDIATRYFRCRHTHQVAATVRRVSAIRCMNEVAERLAAMAIGLFGMRETEEVVRVHVYEYWRASGAPPSALAAAADAVTALPEPPLETAEKSEALAPIRALLGADQRMHQLAAMLKARKRLQAPAHEQDPNSEHCSGYRR